MVYITSRPLSHHRASFNGRLTSTQFDDKADFKVQTRGVEKKTVVEKSADTLSILSTLPLAISQIPNRYTPSSIVYSIHAGR